MTILGCALIESDKVELEASLFFHQEKVTVKVQFRPARSMNAAFMVGGE
jgi:hypothetical protein